MSCVTGPEKQKILEFFSQYSKSLREKDLEPIYSNMVRESWKKGEFYSRVGDTNRNIGFVCKGLFKTYIINASGEVCIRGFCDVGVFVGNYAHLLSKIPSPVYNEAVEDAEVLSVDYSLIEELSETQKSWLEFSRRYAEYRYLMKDKRELELLTLKALDRYLLFLKEQPRLMGRVSQSDIASYMGVAPESLSRLRKQVKDLDSNQVFALT